MEPSTVTELLKNLTIEILETNNENNHLIRKKIGKVKKMRIYENLAKIEKLQLK